MCRATRLSPAEAGKVPRNARASSMHVARGRWELVMIKAQKQTWTSNGAVGPPPRGAAPYVRWTQHVAHKVVAFSTS